MACTNKKKIVSREEFEKHTKLGDCWIEIEGKAYDVSSWMKRHPGGERVLECLGGRDASLPFLLNHPPNTADKYLQSFYVGELEKSSKITEKNLAITNDFKKMYQECEEKGWFELTNLYYLKKTCIVLAMLFGVLFLFYNSCNYDNELYYPIAICLRFTGAVILGMFWQQTAFIGHDVGHNAVFTNNFWNNMIGLFYGNLSIGISGGWWKYTHNVHHIRTNDLEFDPDIQHMPVVSITNKYFGDVWSKFHRHAIPPTDFITSVVSKLCVSYQRYHWIFTLGLSRLFLYISSFVFVFYIQPNYQNGKNVSKLFIFLEQISLILYHVWTVSIFYFFCPNHPILYYFIAYMTSGILHIQIVMNHYPCPVFEDIEEDNFVLHQFRSSMAISSNKWSHWFYGGLQFQVEHHLFPRMPRPYLRKVKPLLLEFCEKHEIEYLENTFWGCIQEITRILTDVSMDAHKLHIIHAF